MANYKIYKNIRIAGTKGDDGDAAESDITAPIGAIFALDSDTVPTGYQETNPPEPPTPEPDYLYKWDFTKSLVDEKQGKIATLSGSATQGNNGVIISANDGLLNFLGSDEVMADGKVIEIDMSLNIDDIHAQRSWFILGDSSNNDGYYFMRPLNTWKMYYSQDQHDSSISWSEVSNFNILANGGILKFEVANQTMKVYLNDELVQQFDNFTTVNLYGIIGKGSSTKSAYTMTIRSIKIYENE